MEREKESCIPINKEEYQLLFNSITDAVVIHYTSAEMPGKIISVNDAACAMLGYRRGELLTMEIRDIDAPEHEEKNAEILQSLYTKGKTLFETELVTKDGRRIPVEVNVRLFEYKGASAVLSVARDITNRKQAEEEIQKRLNYEYLFSEISSLAIVVDDLVAFQDQCLRIMGEVLNVSRVYIFEHRHDTETMDNTFEWVNAGILRQKSNLQELAAANVPWWIEMMKNNKVINYDDIEEMPGEKEKEILRAQEIKSILVVPLKVGGKYYGFMGFDECLTNRKWPIEDVDLLISASRVMTGAIERKRAEEAVRLYSRELEESNSALKVLLRQRDKDRKEMEEKILANVNQLVMPHVEMLKRTGRLSPEDMSHIRIIESNLKEIVSSFSCELLLSNLTPKELLIANLVKEGRRDKDIAVSLNLSIDTVKVHRKNIRRKLGITSRKNNLRSYLSSL